MKKKILITGSTSGFGYAAVEKLLAAGHTVYAAARNIEGRNKEAANKLEALGAHTIEIDVTRPSDIERAFETLTELDVLINNAGVAQLGPTEGYTNEQVRHIFEVNVGGIHAMNRAALPLLKRSSDALIIYTASVLGRVCLPGSAIYTASKWAVEGYAEALSYELAPLGIDSAIVEPGAMGTEIMEKMMQPSESNRISDYGHLQEMGETMQEALSSLMQGEDANNPLDVAQAYVDLINMPNNGRPLRTPVGKDSVLVQELNAKSVVAQSATIDFYGMSGVRTHAK